jgi:hypothetical protein
MFGGFLSTPANLKLYASPSRAGVYPRLILRNSLLVAMLHAVLMFAVCFRADQSVFRRSLLLLRTVQLGLV